MEQKYSPGSIEKKWQQYWENAQVFKVGENGAGVFACGRPNDHIQKDACEKWKCRTISAILSSIVDHWCDN